MGKKRLQQAYDPEAMAILSAKLRKVWSQLTPVGTPKLEIEVENLERVINTLPAKNQSPLVRFCGLTPRSINHLKQENTRTQPPAIEAMSNEAFKVMLSLFDLEYMASYCPQARNIVQAISKKINKNGVDYVSNVDCAKYLYLFFLFLLTGPNINFGEQQADINLVRERTLPKPQQFALLQCMWNVSTSKLQDQSINLGLLMATLDKLDVRDSLTMLLTAGLPISSNDETNFEVVELRTLAELRNFKETLFGKGTWQVTNDAVYGLFEGEKKDNFGKILSVPFSQIQKDFGNLGMFKTRKKVKIVTSTGEKFVPGYRIGGLLFTDLESLSIVVCEIFKIFINYQGDMATYCLDIHFM